MVQRRSLDEQYLELALPSRLRLPSREVEGHAERDRAINPNRAPRVGFLLVDLQVSGSVRNGDRADDGRGQNGVSAMPQAAGERQFREPFDGRSHLLPALSERLQRNTEIRIDIG